MELFSYVQPSWPNIDNFELNLHSTIEPILSSQYSADQSFDDVGQPGSSRRDLNSGCISNPLIKNISALDIEMDSSGTNRITHSLPTSLLMTEQSDAQKIKGLPNTTANMLSDPTAVQLCEFWLQLYPEVFPKDLDIYALSQLTHQPPASIEQWLNSKIRLVPSSSRDSDIGSSTSSTVSFVASSKTTASGGNFNIIKAVHPQITNGDSDFHLSETVSPQMLRNDLNDGEPSLGLDSAPVDDRASLITIPETRTRSLLVSRSLLEAAQSSRARISCHPTSDITCLKRNSNKPLQCTRKCGYRTAVKKDWKRHESNTFPQHGFLCTVPAAVRIDNVTFCTYCPAEVRQPNPTIEHMGSEHGRIFSSESDMEISMCNQVCHRKEHMETHFSKIHPGIHPNVGLSIRAFDIKHSAFPKRCGFCTKAFTSWAERINHIQIHFERDGLDMQQWQDLDDSDDHRNKRQQHDNDSTLR